MNEDDITTPTTNYFKVCSYETSPQFFFFDDRSIAMTQSTWSKVQQAVNDMGRTVPHRFVSVSVWRRPRVSGPWGDAKIIGENAIAHYRGES